LNRRPREGLATRGKTLGFFVGKKGLVGEDLGLISHRGPVNPAEEGVVSTKGGFFSASQPPG